MSEKSGESKNEIFIKEKFNAKDKIKLAVGAGVFLILGATVASAVVVGSESKEKEKKQTQPVIASNSNANFNNIPDYIDQNKKIEVTNASSNQKSIDTQQPKNNSSNEKEIGDIDVSSINDKQLSTAASVSPITPEKPNQQIKNSLAERAAEDDEIYLGTRKKSAKSPYEVMAGTFIPATLQTGLNSELAGYATAVVRQNVYDSITGTYLLIPKGTKIFGKYDSKVAYGQKRLMLTWQRLMFGDGSSISLKGMQGTDKEGYSGFQDQVDNHLASLMSGAILMSIIGAGAQLSQPQTSTGVTPSQNEMVGQVIAGQAGNQIASITGQVVQKNLNISPTIMIRAGYEFNIIVNKDIILEPYIEDN
jgi:type IV secretion system protein VirB10